MQYYAIMAWDESNRVTKYAVFAEHETAEAHITAFSESYPLAFIFAADVDRIDDVLVDAATQTATISPAPVVYTAADVNAEKDRRINQGFMFDGMLFQSRSDDRENIAGAKSAASDALAAGAQPGNYAWQQLLDSTLPDTFAWIAADNTIVPMDAQTVVRFGHAALAHKQSLIFAARNLKNMNPIPDPTIEAYWP